MAIKMQQKSGDAADGEPADKAAKNHTKNGVLAKLAEVNKKIGDIAKTAKELSEYDVERIPTGVLDFDIATGGGFPKGKVSIVFGPESSGKTNLIYKAIANHQRLWPDEICVFVDIENAFDGKWAAHFGVDIDLLQVINPDFAEQAVDIIDMLMGADDIGLIILDSVAGLVTHAETEKSAEGALVGGAALVVGKLTRKVVLGQMKAKREGRTPTFIAVNQIRLKIGVMMGDPETMPGGKPLPFASSMTARLYGKNEVVKEVNAAMPALKVTSFILRKWKVPITQTHGEYKMIMLAHNGFTPGDVDDWNPLTHKMKQLGLMDKVGTKFSFYGEEFPTVKAIRAHVYGTPGLIEKVRADVCKRMLEVNTTIAAQDDDDAEA